MAGESVLAKMAVLISANTAQFNQALSASSKQTESFGNVLKSTNTLLASFGIGFGALQVFNAIKSGVGIMADFEHTMSEVKAITGATGKEFEALEKDALRLGASTKFTATQVGQLQVAYGRLGFTTKEILAATEATLDLAAATGEDLAKSADVAGSTVRGFGLDASETQRVVDVMASSFNKTALGLENFTESMKYVAPIANAANVSVEETTALLGVLADSGIRGSMAGTALRKIFGDLSKDGRPVQERLKELSDKGITLADSFDEVGRTAQTALLVITKNGEKADNLTRAFKNASGEAAQMARIMSDDFEGDVTKLTSAWEGMILALSNTGPIRRATQSITGLINAFVGNIDADLFFRNLADASQKGIKDLEPFKKELIEVRREAGKPFDEKFISDLIKKYDLSSVGAERFRKVLDDINTNISFQEQAIRDFNAFADRNGYKDLSAGADDYIDSINKTIIALTNQQQAQKQQGIDFNSTAFDKSNTELQKQIDAYLKVIEIVKEFKKTTSTIVPPDGVVSTKGLIEEIEEKIRKVEQALPKAFTVPQIRQLQNELKGLQDQLTLLITPDVSRPLDFLDVLLESFGAQDIKPIEIPAPSTEGFEEAVKSFRERVTESFKEIKGELIEIDLSGLVSNAVSDLAYGLGQASAGIGNFGQVILKALVGFARQFGEILIGLGIAALAAKKLAVAPQTAIIAGVALVALAGVASAALSRGQSNYNSGSSGSGASVSDSGTNRIVGNGGEMRIDLTVTGKASGRDLVYVLDNYNVSRGRTG